MRPKRMVAAPEVRFEDLARRLEALGWVRDPGTTSSAPLVPGEPEVAQWNRPQSEATLHYTFQPVFRMRSLEFRGPLSGSYMAEAEAAIPSLAPTDMVALMRSSETRAALLGIFAAAELEDVLLYDEVRRLAGSDDQPVARAAEYASQRLREAVLRDMAAATASACLPDPQARRQVIRRLPRNPPEPAILAAEVAAALSDPDWEVRASAMLVAARLGLRGLALQIRRLKLPSSPRERVHSHDGRILEAARAAALELLDGRVPAGELLDDPRRRNLYRCVAGRDPVTLDRVFLLLHALGAPIETPVNAPPSPPCGFALAWVPAVRHWIGAVDDLAAQWPLRAMDSPGYFVAKQPLDNGAPVSWERAVSRIEALARETGLPFHLPSKELLEMARRGNDGRLFPWGNGGEELQWPLLSPWGLQLSAVPEWTASKAADGESLHTAAPGDLRCAAFAAAEPVAAIRPVLLL